MPIEAPETQTVTTWKVACDGGEGALGPPPRLAVDPGRTPALSNAATATSAM